MRSGSCQVLFNRFNTVKVAHTARLCWGYRVKYNMPDVSEQHFLLGAIHFIGSKL